MITPELINGFRFDLRNLKESLGFRIKRYISLKVILNKAIKEFFYGLLRNLLKYTLLNRLKVVEILSYADFKSIKIIIANNHILLKSQSLEPKHYPYP